MRFVRLLCERLACVCVCETLSIEGGLEVFVFLASLS